MPTLHLCLLRLPVITGICLLLGGCQLWPFNRLRDEPPAAPSTEVAQAEELRQSAPSVGSAMNLLQEGEENRAEAMLEQLLEEHPGDATVRLLLAQIRQPPEDLLGETYEEVEVQPGESLSAIAGRTINNELLFYSLAKLNDIEIPRLLRPGQRLRVPKMEPAEPTERAGSQTDAAPPVAQDTNQLESTARRLVERQSYSQAYALLLSAARAGKLPDGGAALLAESAVGVSDLACREDDPERADKYLRQAAPWLGAAADGGAFARQQRHVDARLKLSDAEQLLARGEEAAAFDALMAARQLDDELAVAHGQKLARLEAALGEYYHDRALSAWRDQEVDRSVELWDRVVRINPGFEPAIRYLERARRAQRELESLEGG